VATNVPSEHTATPLKRHMSVTCYFVINTRHKKYCPLLSILLLACSVNQPYTLRE